MRIITAILLAAATLMLTSCWSDSKKAKSKGPRVYLVHANDKVYRCPRYYVSTLPDTSMTFQTNGGFNLAVAPRYRIQFYDGTTAFASVTGEIICSYYEITSTNE